jgi:hypothetical protein
MTPATEVTNVAARAAGATSAGGLPEPQHVDVRLTAEDAYPTYPGPSSPG